MTPSSLPSASRRWIRVPALVNFAPLQSCSDSPRSVSPTSSPGMDRGVAWHRCPRPVPVRPSIDLLSGVHSRVGVATSASCPGLPAPCPVPTSWFCTTSPVCSAVRPVTGAAARPPRRTVALRVAGLLRPAADRGVRRVSSSALPVARLRRAPRAAVSPRRIPPIRSRTASPRPAPFSPFPRRSARTSRVRVAAPAVQSASCRERRPQGLALWMGPYRRAPFPTRAGLPSRGLALPFKVLRVARDHSSGLVRRAATRRSERRPVPVSLETVALPRAGPSCSPRVSPPRWERTPDRPAPERADLSCASDPRPLRTPRGAPGGLDEDPVGIPPEVCARAMPRHRRMSAWMGPPCGAALHESLSESEVVPSTVRRRRRRGRRRRRRVHSRCPASGARRRVFSRPSWGF